MMHRQLIAKYVLKIWRIGGQWIGIFLISFVFSLTVNSVLAESAGRTSPNSLRVFRDRLQPHWLGNNDKFWYRVEVGRDRHKYVLVDAVKGSKRSAFDHARLAEALRGAGLSDVEADRLPLEQL